jgi:hypothetical protein
MSLHIILFILVLLIVMRDKLSSNESRLVFSSAMAARDEMKRIGKKSVYINYFLEPSVLFR